MADDEHRNPEIFTVEENVPLAQPPVTTEEVLTLPPDELMTRLVTSPQGLVLKKQNEG